MSGPIAFPPPRRRLLRTAEKVWVSYSLPLFSSRSRNPGKRGGTRLCRGARDERIRHPYFTPRNRCDPPGLLPRLPPPCQVRSRSRLLVAFRGPPTKYGCLIFFYSLEGGSSLQRCAGCHGRLARPCSAAEGRRAADCGKGGQAAHGTQPPMAPSRPWHPAAHGTQRLAAWAGRASLRAHAAIRRQRDDLIWGLKSAAELLRCTQ